MSKSYDFSEAFMKAVHTEMPDAKFALERSMMDMGYYLHCKRGGMVLKEVIWDEDFSFEKAGKVFRKLYNQLNHKY